MPAGRRFGLAIFRLILSILTRRRYTDPTSGYQAISKSALAYYTSRYFPSDYPDANVIFFLWKAGIKVVEVPAIFHPSPKGKVSLHSGLKPLFYVFKMLRSLVATLIKPVPKDLEKTSCRYKKDQV